MIEARSPAERSAGRSPARKAAASTVRAVLLSGGDERLALDPRTGRNRYGAPLEARSDEVWFASSTASPASARGLQTAAGALAGVLRPGGKATAGGWADAIRARIRALFPCPGAETVLSASGTDAELIVLALARGILELPLTTLVMAPSETGRGVALAASGRHFLDSSPSGSGVLAGSRVAGLEGADIEVRELAIRCPDGVPLSEDEVDAAALTAAEAALRAGRGVILHCLDASKTGIGGVRRETASRLAAAWSGRVLTVVDACQLRCPPEQVGRDLAAGFIVVITGSKFAGGPAFSGAVLLPPALVAALGSSAFPRGLAAHTSLDDWPSSLRDRIRGTFGPQSNLGLYARWEAALGEYERYAAIDPVLREDVVVRFAARVEAGLARTPGCRPAPGGPPGRCATTIHPLLATGRDGADLPADLMRAGLTAAELRGSGDGSGRAFHLGQPVQVGGRTALRLCLGAANVVDVAERVAGGRDRAAAFEPLGRDVDDFFAKWGRLCRRVA